MTPTPIVLLMIWMSATAVVALIYTALVYLMMTRRTHHGVRLAYLMTGAGYLGLVLSVIDYLHGDPIAWPWLLLGSISLVSTGTALMHVITRRLCRCPECPIRSSSRCAGRRG